MRIFILYFLNASIYLYIMFLTVFELFNCFCKETHGIVDGGALLDNGQVDSNVRMSSLPHALNLASSCSLVWALTALSQVASS